MADIILYTCAHWPPDDPDWQPGSENLEDFLNGESRAGRTLAFILPSIDGRHVTLIFTSPLVYP
jgi:hypothetical protein